MPKRIKESNIRQRGELRKTTEKVAKLKRETDVLSSQISARKVCLVEHLEKYVFGVFPVESDSLTG